jgi:hypothetical protein
MGSTTNLSESRVIKFGPPGTLELQQPTLRKVRAFALACAEADLRIRRDLPLLGRQKAGGQIDIHQ